MSSITNRFISHKWKDESGIERTRSLDQHLLEVGTSMYKNMCNFPKRERDLEKVGIITGIFHDFGKFTSYFQNYIKGGRDQEYKEHAFISALYGGYFGLRIGLKVEYVYIIYSSILHHHSNLCNLDEDAGRQKIVNGKLYSPNGSLSRRVNAILEAQIKDLRRNQIGLNSILLGVINEFNQILEVDQTFISDFLNEGYVDIFNRIVDFCLSLSHKKIEETVALKLIYNFSSLIDSDKFSAAGLKNPEVTMVDPMVVETFRQNKFNLNKRSYVNDLRNSIYVAIKKSVSELNLNEHVFTITAPTGSGKTIASIMAALQIAKKIRESHGKISRIIYALPFVTLLEQNFMVAEKIFSIIPDFKENPQKYIISHHHLAEPKFEIDGDKLPTEKALLFVESWDSFFIVTTFVQLFESLISNINRKLKKVHNIANSIVIIDEIQSIDVALWSTIRDILKKFSAEFNVYFIIMSATLPEIYPNASELSGSPQQIEERFKSVNRVNINVNIEPCTIEEAIKSKSQYFGEKSILFIFNTIESSIQAFNHLKECIKGLEIDTETFYISGNLTPKDKEEILKEILDKIKNHKKPIVVGTQIFEAGVDIDFDIVIRDICPIDSIIQASGRANRNGNSSKGDVFVIDSSKDMNSPGYYSVLVYGRIHTDVSLEILRKLNSKVIEERDVKEIVSEYYNKLKEKYLDGESIYLTALNKLNFGRCKSESDEDFSSDFKIINGHQQCGIFIEENEEAKDLLRKFKEIKRLDSPIERRNEFLKIKRDFYRYVINIEEEKIKKYNLTCQKEGSLYIMPQIAAESQYDRKTGIKNCYEGGFIL